MGAPSFASPHATAWRRSAYRKYRKNWLDNAIVGLKSEGASLSATWPADVNTGDAMIHAVDTILVPGGYVPT